SSSPSGRSWGELVMGGPPTLSPERCEGTGTIIGLRAVRGENRKRWVSVRPVHPSPRFLCTVVVPTAVEQQLNAPGNLVRRSARRACIGRSIQMTGNLVSCRRRLDERRLGDATGHRKGTARVETAAGRRRQGARDLAFDRDALPLVVGMGRQGRG